MEHLLRATARAEARHFWFRGFRSFVTPLIAQAADGRSDLRLLDAGCGTGANVELLQRFGRGFGFDLSETGVRLGREAGRTRLARATVTAAPFPSGAFDVVTSFDVLYSLQDDAERAALREMYRLLRPGGYAVISVAAMEMLRGDHSVLGREVRRYSGAEDWCARTTRGRRTRFRFRRRRSTRSSPARFVSKRRGCGGSTCRSAARCCASRENLRLHERDREGLPRPAVGAVHVDVPAAAALRDDVPRGRVRPQRHRVAPP